MKASEIIGDNIRIHRTLKGVKQEGLAKNLGISKGRMSQIENGNCKELTISRIERIAAYLQVDFFKIVSDIPHQNSGNNSVLLNGVVYNLSPDLIKTLADELVTRMNK